jgi:hypothetical protein
MVWQHLCLPHFAKCMLAVIYKNVCNTLPSNTDVGAELDTRFELLLASISVCPVLICEKGGTPNWKYSVSANCYNAQPIVLWLQAILRGKSRAQVGHLTTLCLSSMPPPLLALALACTLVWTCSWHSFSTSQLAGLCRAGAINNAQQQGQSKLNVKMPGLTRTCQDGGYAQCQCLCGPATNQLAIMPSPSPHATPDSWLGMCAVLANPLMPTQLGTPSLVHTAPAHSVLPSANTPLH